MDIEPGVYEMAFAEYYAADAINKSGLDQIHRSPAHYQAYLAHGRKATAAMKFGSLVHTLVLEPDTFSSLYAVPPRIDRRTNAGKEEYAAWLAESAGKEDVDEEDRLLAEKIAAAIRSHPTAGALLRLPGWAERSVFWTDERTGVLCKCRPDYWTEEGYIIDLKTTEDATPDAFCRQAFNLRYHVQSAFYQYGVSQYADTQLRTIHICPEKKEPFAVGVFLVNAEAIGIGQREYRKDLDLYAQCLSREEWPAYTTDIQPLGVPVWAQ